MVYYFYPLSGIIRYMYVNGSFAGPIGILSSIDKNGRSGLVGAIARGQNTFFMNGYWLEPIGVLSSIVVQQVRMMGGGWWVSWW